MSEEMSAVDGEDMEMKCVGLLTSVKDPGRLQDACALLGITVPREVIGKRKPLYKILIEYLNSDMVQKADDFGEAVFKKLLEFFDDKLHPMGGVGDHLGAGAREVVSEKPDVPVVENKMRTVIDMERVKEFKISGRIGCAGEKDKLSYESLSYQIKVAKNMGYSEESISSAIIKAITPGSNLRTYLESRRSVELPSLLAIMRSHFREKDSATYFTELSNAVQASHENCYDFVVRLMVIRDKVISLSEEEGCPQNPNVVKQRFAHTMLTGLRNNNIRHELRDYVKRSPFVQDEILLSVITEAVANETEHLDKVEKRTGKVNVIGGKEDFSEKREKEPPLPQQLKEVKSYCEGEMSKLRQEMSEIKGLLQESVKAQSPGSGLEEIKELLKGVSMNSNQKPPWGPRFQRVRKCEACRRSNTDVCSHCFKCGLSGHRAAGCSGNE